MKAFIITLIKNSNSLDYAETCLKSIKDTDSQLDAQIYPQVLQKVCSMLTGPGL